MMIFKHSYFTFLMVLTIGCLQASDKISDRDAMRMAHKSQENLRLAAVITDKLNQIEALNSPGTVKTIATQYKNIHEDTPINTKQVVGEAIALKIIGPQVQDLTVQNENMRTLLTSQSDASRLLLSTSPFVGSPVRRASSFVDAEHASTKKRKLDNNGNMIGISGGHNASSYTPNEICSNNKYDCFLGQDGQTIGVFVDDEHPKTTRFGFTEEEIVQNLKYGTTVAISPENKNLVVSQSPKGYIVESYAQKDNQLLQPTQYPVLTIDPKNCNSHGLINAGRFAKFNKDFSGLEDCGGQGFVRIPTQKFNEMMSAGQYFDTKHQQDQLVDITVPMTHYCYEDYLKPMNKTEMPGKIYGIRTVSSSSSTPSLLSASSLPSPFMSRSSSLPLFSASPQLSRPTSVPLFSPSPCKSSPFKPVKSSKSSKYRDHTLISDF